MTAADIEDDTFERFDRYLKFGWIEIRTKDLLDADLCLDVHDQCGLKIKFADQTFDMQLDYAIAGTVRRRGMYRVSCGALDEYLLDERAPKSAKPPVLSKLLTQTRAFRVVPTERNWCLRRSISIDRT
jgi:hypothetical protein